MKTALVFILLTCTGCLCTKCRDCEASHKPEVHEQPTLDFRAQKYDDTNRDTSYKGRQTSKSLYRPDTRGSIAEANYRQYPPRKYKNDNSNKNRGC
jgi:hypothetical protein